MRVLEEVYLNGGANMKKKKYNGNNYATFWRRFLAYIIDGLVLIPIAIVCLTYNKYFIEHRIVLPVIAENLITYGYLIILPPLFGGTLGKLAMRIRIIDTSGNNITYIKSVLRNLPYAISTILFIFTKFIFVEKTIGSCFNSINMVLGYFIYIDALVLIFSPQKKAAHDYIAGTFVINKK
ncbi:MAG: hypothetical protein K0R09_177 [Clostridiales bacterium]|jgi:uncharacterized RDD family membrane protein YckC|nr:hypothetical protein [Clostridiales bacterium]